MLKKLQLDSAGIGEILKGPEVRELIDGLAERVAADARARIPSSAPVEVRGYTTDRGAATVVIAHREAMGWQARTGVLTRAAGAAGLEVKAWQR